MPSVETTLSATSVCGSEIALAEFGLPEQMLALLSMITMLLLDAYEGGRLLPIPMP